MLRGEPRGGKRPPSCGLPSASARRIPRFRLAGSVPGRLLRCFRSGAFCIRRPSGTALPRRISVRFGFGSCVRSFRRLFSPDSPPLSWDDYGSCGSVPRRLFPPAAYVGLRSFRSAACRLGCSGARSDFFRPAAYGVSRPFRPAAVRASSFRGAFSRRPFAVAPPRKRVNDYWISRLHPRISLWSMRPSIEKDPSDRRRPMSSVWIKAHE